ncbi:MAG: hypothetical protein IPL83_00740 [Bdellovibrionales bacterium]|nr:hypothetical protein [Bdellovibrionales bacterium]
MNEFLASISGFVESFRILSRAFADPRRSEAFVNTMDRIEPLVVNMNAMSLGVTKMTQALNRDGRMELMAGSLANLTDELKVILPDLTREAPHIGKQLGQFVTSMTILAKEFEAQLLLFGRSPLSCCKQAGARLRPSMKLLFF